MPLLYLVKSVHGKCHYESNAETLTDDDAQPLLIFDEQYIYLMREPRLIFTNAFIVK